MAPLQYHPALWLPLAFSAGALLMWLWQRAETRRAQEELKVRLAELRTERDALSGSLRRADDALRAQREQNQALQIRVTQLHTARAADAEKLAWLDQAQARMRDTFEALAGQTLQKSADAFARRARENAGAMLDQMRGDWRAHTSDIRHLVDPVRESLTALDGHVRHLEQTREGAYQGLMTQVDHLARAHTELQATTLTLTQALKSSSVRGRWGEMQLRRVVEMSGMVRHVAFEEQVSTNGGRPDMIVHLPNAGILPVDAKVPLAAWLRAVESPDDADRKRQLTEYARAVQARVRELGQKRYWQQFEHAPDFVVMFMPSEPCLGAAFEIVPDLLDSALKQQVLITTPVTLIALLKSVAYGWQQYQMTENARSIVAQGRALYKRLETFNSHIAELGKNLNRTVAGYNRAVGSLERRLVPAARRFREMGGDDPETAVPEGLDIQARIPADRRTEREAPDTPDGYGKRTTDRSPRAPETDG
ncbi:DNA recombination protein RmuC [Desulfonema ishimotonii]|uniref:DNA recombination protein RmuC n=1 Tax=Desulfonema ishimotonii TaxID=45657 RepID=A0A401G1P5_9BACT|nr:DNA recombination protein RmuC [Desulfonema ishimotonii]GBC63142.1 DNA recombination protein RmuC [Desulfonema ishimotonii]